MKLLAALTCLGIAACVFPTDSAPASAPRRVASSKVASSGVVEGRVVRSSGAPAAGVLIQVVAAAAPCPATTFTAQLLSPDTVRTSDAGIYTLPVVLNFGSTAAACVRLTAQPTTGTAVSTVPVTLTPDSSTGSRVRIDIQLPD